MSPLSPAQSEPRSGAVGVGAGVSLLVLLTLSMQIVLGGDGQLASLRGENARVCVKRLPTAMVRVIRDLTERREPAAPERAPMVSVPAERTEPIACEREVSVMPLELGEWLLDLPPPAKG